MASAVLATFALLAFAACGSENPAGPESETEDDLSQVLLDAGGSEEVDDAYSETEPAEFEENSRGEQYFCTRQTVSLTRGYTGSGISLQWPAPVSRLAEFITPIQATVPR